MNAAAPRKIGATANLVKSHKESKEETKMRKFIKATALTMALAVPAWAGNMGCPVAPPPEGRQAITSTEPGKTGDMGNPIDVSEISISLLQSLLALI